MATFFGMVIVVGALRWMRTRARIHQPRAALIEPRPTCPICGETIDEHPHYAITPYEHGVSTRAPARPFRSNGLTGISPSKKHPWSEPVQPPSNRNRCV